MIVVSDTSVINYLLQLNEIEIMPALFTKVLIPTAVMHELQSAGTPANVKIWAGNPPAWFEICQVSHENLIANLDPGEAEAIALAQLMQCPILIDETKGRRAAEKLGLTITGLVVSWK